MHHEYLIHPSTLRLRRIAQGKPVFLFYLGMNILCTRFPFTSAEGGAENQTTWLAAGLRERGHDVRFLGSCPVLLKRFAQLNAHVSRLSIGLPPVTKWLALSFLWRKKKMQKQLIDAVSAMPKPDAIIMLSLTEKILLTEWAHEQGMKVLWVEHDRVGPWLTRSPWLSELKRLSEYATTVCVSDLSKAMYDNLGFSHVTAVPNGVPVKEGRRQKAEGSNSDVLRLGCIARLSPEKGIDVLLEAIADIPEVGLTIVGQGPEEGYLRSLITADTERMGGARVELLSSVSDLDAFYESIDALVLPSRDHDPFGLVAAEAMVRGIPVLVTSACGVAGYLLDEEDAVIVSPEDPSEMNRGIHQLLDGSFRKHLSEMGAARAKELFSLPAMIERYEALLAH